jgi:hypothetical protein
MGSGDMCSTGHGIQGAAYESEGHAACMIITEGFPNELFGLIAFAVPARKTRPPILNGQIKAFSVMSAEHVTPNLVATFHGHVAHRSLTSHDFLLGFWVHIYNGIQNSRAFVELK